MNDIDHPVPAGKTQPQPQRRTEHGAKPAAGTDGLPDALLVEPSHGLTVGTPAEGHRKRGLDGEANVSERERYERIRSRLTPTQRAMILAHLSKIGA